VNSLLPIFLPFSQVLRILSSILIVLSACYDARANGGGFLEGHLTIVSLKTVELAEASPSKETAPEMYAEYRLIVLSRDGQNEIARITADRNGNYRISLPPGDYVLDAEGRARTPKRVRAKPQQFTIRPNQSVRVNMDVDPGAR
jgi:hypothetical protein